MSEDCPYVSRGGLKLAHALDTFGLDPAGLTCADFGCSTGGFTDVLLRRGATKVYAVDTGYGVLDWNLRNDERVNVLERTNAMHVELPEAVNLIVIDANWTRQSRVLPNALRQLSAGGQVVTLVKPHYEADDADRLKKTKGVLPEERLPEVLAAVERDIAAAGFEVAGSTRSPIRGSGSKNRRGNAEFLYRLRPLTRGFDPKTRSS